jgi:hypothetical protein
MKIQIDETAYEGTGTAIMDLLRTQTFDPTEFPDTESYICFLQGNVIRTTGLDFPLPDRDTEKRARTIFAQLAKVGALRMLEA